MRALFHGNGLLIVRPTTSVKVKLFVDIIFLPSVLLRPKFSQRGYLSLSLKMCANGAKMSSGTEGGTDLGEGHFKDALKKRGRTVKTKTTLTETQKVRAVIKHAANKANSQYGPSSREAGRSNKSRAQVNS